MLIDVSTIRRVLRGIPIRGVLHVGAHNCEEMPFYIKEWGLSPSHIHWIEAIPSKVEEARQKSIPNVHQAVISDRDDQPVVFYIANNPQSSSLLKMKTHLIEHPRIWYTHYLETKSTTLDTFFQTRAVDPSGLNVWNLDIQGSELMALRGAAQSLVHVDVLYLEVNERELYEGCAMVGELDAFLEPYGFRRVWTHMTEHGWGDAIYRKETT